MNETNVHCVCTHVDAGSVRELSYASFAGLRGVHRPANLCCSKEGASVLVLPRITTSLSKEEQEA